MENPNTTVASIVAANRLDMSQMQDVQKLHFIGIGGIGMSGIAQMCLEQGFRVSGSDMKESDITRKLTSRGAQIFMGHAAANVQDADMVVISSAIQKENPELVEAQSRGVRIQKRAQILGWLMSGKDGIAVAGAHGKTTTTSLMSWLLEEGGQDPTLIVGGEANNSRNNVRFGKGPHLVAEADESDASFLNLPARIAIVTNIDDDHMDFYGHIGHLTEVFLEFMNRIDPEGFIVACTDCPRLRELLPRVTVPAVTYGLEGTPDYTADQIEYRGGSTRFRLRVHGVPRGHFEVGVPGRHNLQNALGAITVALNLGVTEEDLARGLRSFEGVKRRYQLLGEAAGIRVFDDYAHHPTEIQATLASVRLSDPRRLVVLFQPHRFSRTELLASSFASSFRDADLVLLMPIYGAGEIEKEGVATDTIYEHLVKAHPYVIQVQGERDYSKLLPLIASQLQEGDVVMTVGAGDVYEIGHELLEFLGKDEGPA